MAEPIVKYATAPTLSFSSPTCRACSVEVLDEDEEWCCPTCGTSWPHAADEDTRGELYENWSGETLDLPLTDPSEAWRITIRANEQRVKQQRAAQNARAVIVRAERAEKARREEAAVNPPARKDITP